MIQTGLDGILKLSGCFVPGWICRFEIQILLRRQPGIEHGIRWRSRSIGKTTALTLGFTWLNPHVYLDTVLLIGEERWGWVARQGLLCNWGDCCIIRVFLRPWIRSQERFKLGGTTLRMEIHRFRDRGDHAPCRGWSLGRIVTIS